ncbi:MAG TPA: class I SAM-dependent methyltransferase [Candidatus Angelobacter sp.]|nr:class I SAM-dependent methyltransferase [Candidatus Angelobacter sp.]
MRSQPKSWPQPKPKATLHTMPAPAAAPSWFERLFQELNVPGEIKLPNGRIVATGEGIPRFRITVHSNQLLRHAVDELALGEAYINGDLDLDGDMLAILDVRKQFAERMRLVSRLHFFSDLFLTPISRAHKKVIDRHYTFGNDFYFYFLDSYARFYSHCLFDHDDELLEKAAERKLEKTFQALELRPGMRLLDIGAGWGGTFEHFCPRGVRVTGVTLFQNSFDYVQELIQRKKLDATIILEDFFTYKPAEPFDAIVTYGVIEHMPEYRRFFERAWKCLKPGGLIYLDGSASKEKYSLAEFTRRYIWQGAHSCMCLQDVVKEGLNYGFNIVEVKEESHDYELTMLNWARRLDLHRKEIVERWGEKLYRIFRLFLWGGVPAFHDDQLQAYHLVARRGEDPGLRPGLGRRISEFVKEMASS